MRVAVEVGVHGDRRDAELAARAHDADRDLAAVRDQDFAEQRGSFTDRPGNRTPYPTAVPDRRPHLGRAAHAWHGPSASPRSTPRTGTCSTRRAAARADGLVAVADHQTAGRGRLDRRWEAPPGSSLLVSVLLRPAPPGDASPGARSAVMAAALALAEAVDAVAGVDAGLKWPNDLVVGDRKLAGLLAEARRRRARGRRRAATWTGRRSRPSSRRPRPRATSKRAAPSTATRCSTRSSHALERAGSTRSTRSSRAYRDRLGDARPAGARRARAATTLEGDGGRRHRRRRARRARRRRHRRTPSPPATSSTSAPPDGVDRRRSTAMRGLRRQTWRSGVEVAGDEGGERGRRARR